MSWTWAARLPVRSLAHAAALRLWPGIEARLAGGELWLRGQDGGQALELRLRALPGATRFSRDGEGRLVPAGRVIPAGRLADDGWSPLALVLAPAAPATSLPGRLGTRPRLRLVRDGDEVAPDLLATPLAAFAEWASTAAAVRLQPLAFCADAHGRALVSGRPLPPLPGELWTEQEGIALPLGLRLEPRVPLATIKRLLRLPLTQLALFYPDASFERVPRDAFVHASRPAVRASARIHDAG